ncbi:hypothetical protein CEP52_014512 [Fusarium oligoseptatum]|uniref:Uncharacterized protein n=1 Tax=Fusarium oligoseptatum TaxID=2604345 RepID=A0A428SLG8_9HYPO|nr:hypothetical protein CEP52_014512 [Fusarium oligoseptatum]
MAKNPQQSARPVEQPKFHYFTDSWINDPCAPGYDPWTKTYHLFYQCNPEGCEWGNMSWGHVVSKDMLTWSPASMSPALAPDQPYDSQGVFTGCWIPPSDAGDTTLRVAYSSVRHLPFHWSTPPYPRDAAGLAIATSRDSGVTWEKSPRNPILTGEPAGLRVTGFRDPYVTRLPAISEALGSSTMTRYGLISGGIQDAGPTTFLYAINDDNVEEWTYLGPLVDIPARFQPSKKWSGNYGLNWECTNIVTLHAGSESRHFLIIGAEGDVEKAHVKNHDQPAGVPSRTVRGQVWMSGNLTRVEDGVRFGYEHGGYLDHGPLYAANSFVDPVSKRHIVYAWIPEEDISLEAAKRKGWNGSLAIPREIFLLRVPNVERTLRSTFAECCPFEVKTEADGSTTILTLGVKPIDEMARLRESCTGLFKLETAIMLPDKSGLAHLTVYQTQSSSWELEAIISINSECQSVGFNIRHNQDLSIHTTITFCTITERIIVNREASTTDTTINKCPDAGPFTLLMQKKENGSEMAKLHLRIFSDGDILEVFANDRFALATMVYSQSYEQENSGITAFANGSAGSAVFESVTIWDGLNAKE